MIHFSTKFIIGMCCLIGVIFVANGNIGGAIFAFIIAAINACWYSCVRALIPFAGQNLAVACQGIKEVGPTYLQSAVMPG